MSKLPARLLIVLLLALPWSVAAGTFVVDTTVDDPALTTCDDAAPNDCSLRGAILEANARPPSEANTINVPAGVFVLSQASTCSYYRSGNPNLLTSSQIPLCLSTQTTIQGAGAAATIIDGDQRGRVLFVGATAVVSIRGVTIRNGLADYSFDENPNGGGINNHGTLTLTETVVRENQMAQHRRWCRYFQSSERLAHAGQEHGDQEWSGGAQHPGARWRHPQQCRRGDRDRQHHQRQ